MNSLNHCFATAFLYFLRSHVLSVFQWIFYVPVLFCVPVFSYVPSAWVSAWWGQSRTRSEGSRGLEWFRHDLSRLYIVAIGGL